MPIYMDPKVDFAFKKVFGDKAHKNILICFLNAVLELKDKDIIEDVEYLPSERKTDRLEGHDVILDLYVTDRKKSHYIVEMQRGNLSGYPKRMMYYFSTVFGQCLAVSEPYTELPDVVIVSIIRDIIFPNKKNYKSRHRLIDDITGECDIQGVSYTFVELGKFDKTLEELAPDNIEDRWYYFLKYTNSLTKEAPSELLKVPEIGEAYQILDQYGWLAKDMVDYRKDLMRICDEVSRIDYALNEGRAEGKAEGRAEGELLKQLEIARNLKLANVDIKIIISSTGLSKKDIENL